jgi:hypothetical protein
MLRTVLVHLRAQWIGVLALLIALGTGSAYAANTVFSADIVDGEVKTADLANNAVRTTKIVNGQVANADLDADAVDGSKIFDASVGADDLGFDSVASGEIATDAVNGSEVSVGAIDSDEISDNSLVASDLATGSVGPAEIADGAVTNAELGSSSVDSAKIANNSVTAFDIAGGEANGAINLSAGFVASGRCRDFNVSVGGAEPGDAVLFSINTSIPDGILLYGVRVSSADVVVGKACNLTGAAFPQLTGIQVEIVTISI